MNNKKWKLKKAAVTALSALLMLSLSGCWSYQELNNYSYVVGLGIDKGSSPGKVRIIEQLAVPSALKKGGGKDSGGGGTESFWNVESDGDTVFATIRDITRKVQRKPFYGHNRVLVFGSEVAREGIFTYIDFFVRDSEPRATTWMVVAKNKADEILHHKPHLEKIPADKIEKILESHVYTSSYHNIQIREFVENMLSEGQAAVVPIIEIYEQKIVPSESKEEKGGSSRGDSEKKKPDTVLMINNCAVFKDYKMVGQIDNIQARSYSFVTNNAKGGIIVVDSPDGKEKLDIEFFGVKSKVKPVIKDGVPSISVTVKIRCGLGDQQSKKNYGTPEMLKKIGEKVNAEMKKEIMDCISKSKEMKADIFGFGNEIYRKSPKTWKKLKSNWDEEYKKLDVKVKVEANVEGTATIRSIAKPGEDK